MQAYEACDSFRIRIHIARSHRTKVLVLQRASLADLARECLEATMAGVGGHPAAEPLHFVVAFNKGLQMLAAGVRNTATTAGDLFKVLQGPRI